MIRMPTFRRPLPESGLADDVFEIILWMMALFWIGTAAMGCAALPQSISVDPTFTPSEVAAIKDAKDQWCEVKGWCPDLVTDPFTDGEWRIVRITGDGVLLRGQQRVGSSHTDHALGTTFIDGDLISDWPEMTWLIVAHELGHVQNIKHHDTVECTMSGEFHTEPSFELTCEGPRKSKPADEL